jgi:hypothetical protein
VVVDATVDVEVSVVVAVEVVVAVAVRVDVVVFAPPIATNRLADISTPAITIAAAMTR